jgi:hypothetical protein
MADTRTISPGSYALSILELLPDLLAAGVDVAAMAQRYIERLRAMVDEGRNPTPEEWDELNAERAALTDRLNAPRT